MPDWLNDLMLALVANVVLTGGVVVVPLAVGWLVHRVWADRGLAWLLGKTEAEVRRRPPAASRNRVD